MCSSESLLSSAMPILPARPFSRSTPRPDRRAPEFRFEPGTVNVHELRVARRAREQRTPVPHVPVPGDAPRDGRRVRACGRRGRRHNRWQHCGPRPPHQLDQLVLEVLARRDDRVQVVRPDHHHPLVVLQEISLLSLEIQDDSR